MLRKENDFMRTEVIKERRDLEQAKRQVEIAHVKQEILLKEMVKRIDQLENDNMTLLQAKSDDMCSGVARVLELESKIDQLFPNEALRGDILSASQTWKNRIYEIFDKLDDFERQYLQAPLRIESPSAHSKNDLTSMTPTPAFDINDPLNPFAKAQSRIPANNSGVVTQRRSNQAAENAAI